MVKKSLEILLYLNKGRKEMKNRQDLIGYLIIAIAIIIAGILIANAIRAGFSRIGETIVYHAELLR